MFEDIFGSKYTEMILFYLLKNKKCYANELSDIFHSSLSPIQKSLEKLENASIIVSIKVGNTRQFIFNPRYPFLSEFLNFISKGYDCLPNKIKNEYYEPKIRKRPRKKNKPL